MKKQTHSPLNTSYDIYVIRMSNHPISEMYIRLIEPSWKDYQLSYFEAVTPKDLVYKSKLTFGRKSKKRDFTSTEIAVWYSHFELWCKCVNSSRPMLIIEHDSKLIKPLPDLSKEGHKFLSFIDRDYKPKGKWLAPGSGYYITPIVAQRLVARAVSKEKLGINSDGFLGWNLNSIKQQERGDYQYIEQINIDGLNTIDHKTKHRNFVGPDYENFDIPSVHGQKI